MRGPLRIWLPTIRAGSGTDVFSERLASALSSRGMEATITWFPHLTELVPDILRFAKPPRGTTIIHANSANAFAFKRKAIPLVATEHHYILDPPYRPYKSSAQDIYHRVLIGPYLRRSYALADAITTDCRFTANVLKQVAGVTATRTIPLWVDYDEFSPSGETSPARKDDVFRLLFVGNATRRKGADIIPLLAQRLGTGFEIRCTAGLRQQKRGLMPDNVHVLGRLSPQDLVEEYRDCDAALLPSRYEGFGYSALEAMACGKPVIGFRCGAFEELIAEGQTGLLCGIDDIDTLEANCRFLAANRDIAHELGIAGRVRATSLFTEAKAIDEYMNLYSSLQTD